MSGAEGCPNCAKLEARLAKVEEENARLRRRVEKLEARLNENSQNSSRPPSSDPPQIRWSRPPKPPSERDPGGQPGHEGKTRELLAPSKVDEIVELRPTRCSNPACGRRFRRRSTARGVVGCRRHQVTEIPAPRLHTAEYRLYELRCSRCEQVTSAALPAGVPAGSFGPRLQAITATLTGRYRVTKREVCGLMEDVFGVRMALGSVSTIEQQVSAALKESVHEAHRYAQTEPCAGADETGWTQRRRKAWLWVMVTSFVTVFMILKRRSGEAARKLLGSFRGVLSTDRWPSYGCVVTQLGRRQICWAHLKREFEGFTEQPNATARRIGGELVKQAEKLLAYWYRVRHDTLAWSSFQVYVSGIRQEARALLEEGASPAACRYRPVRNKCREILKLFPALWTFARVRGVEPTNNACERALRPAVLWRKGSFGTHSAAGSRFVERMLTVAATLKQQQRNLLDFLTLAVELRLQREPAPSLLPDSEWILSLKAAL